MTNGLEKQYMGDAVYIRRSPVGEACFILSVEDGCAAHHEIFLEPETAAAIVEYLGHRGIRFQQRAGY